MKKFILSVIIILLVVTGIYVYPLLSEGNESMIAAIEEVRNANTVEYIIHEDRFSEGAYVYYLRGLQNESQGLAVEYVKKTWNGRWKWVYGGGHSGTYFTLANSFDQKALSFSSQFLHRTKIKEYQIPFPIVFGGIFDPAIHRVEIIDYTTGMKHQAQIVPYNQFFRMYYVYLSQSYGKKVGIVAYDHQNHVIDEETIDLDVPSGGSDGKRSEG